MDIQKLITETLATLTADENLLKEFNANPAKTLESKLGIDLPDEQINALVEGIKTKLNLDGAFSALKNLF